MLLSNYNGINNKISGRANSMVSNLQNRASGFVNTFRWYKVMTTNHEISQSKKYYLLAFLFFQKVNSIKSSNDDPSILLMGQNIGLFCTVGLLSSAA